MDELDHRIERLEKLAKEGSRGNSSASNINVNMGGQAVWIAAGCCAVMLAVNGMLMFQINDMKSAARSEKDKQEVINREYQYQLNSLYARYPYLRPEKN